MTRALAVPQSSIIRAIKAVEKAGVPMVIELARDGSLSIVPPAIAKRGRVLNDNDIDYEGEITL